ncbi:MAG: hypothetical protein SWQ30_01600, partial [Thermodesulfobacteriota bacterium]|nr:hypothetical protein [Thermodesulfobacteriota bacterium]
IEKTDDPDPVIAGNELTYTMSVSNVGGSTAHSVILTDTYPVETTYVSGGDSHNASTRTVTWNAFDLAAGASMDFELTVEVIPTTADTTITNTATVDSDETGPVSDDEDTEVNSRPSLTIEKTDDPDPVIAGNELTYTMSVSNVGGSTAHSVILTDTYPPETTYVSGGDSHNASTRTVSWNAFDIAAGASTDFTLTVKVIPTTSDTTITNTATVDSDETDPVTDDEDTEVNSPAALAIEKTDNPDPVIAGDDLTYTISVSNMGGSTAHNVILTDVYPPETTYVSGGDSHNAGTRRVTWNAFDLAAGASTDFTLTVEVIPTTPDTTITNTATVDSDETDPVTDDEDTEVNEPALLQVNKTDDPDPVIAGNELTYTISVSNTGGSTAHNVILTDVYPPETTYVSGGDSHNAGTRTVTWNPFDLAAGASTDFTLTVEVIPTIADTTITNTATVDSDETGPVSDDEDTEVNSRPSLTIEKTDDPDPVIAGNELTYTMSVSNVGGSTAHSVILTDTYPPETTYVSGGDSHNASTRTVSWNAFDIAAGASTDFTLTVKVIPTTSDTTITNTATVDSDETDPVTDDEDTEVNSPAALAIEKTDNPDPVIAGDDLTYTISVGNTGGSTAHNVCLEDIYPPETTYVTGGDSHDPGTRTVAWDCFDLGPGESAAVTLTVNAICTTPEKTILNTASATCDEIPGSVTAIEDTKVIPLELDVTKTQEILGEEPDCVKGGEMVTYHICVANPGQCTIHNVTITDELSEHVEFVSCSDGCSGTHTVAWTRDELGAGETWCVDLIVEVKPSTPMGTLLRGECTVDSDETAPVTVPNITPVCHVEQSGSRPEFDTVGCDATNYFAIDDKIKELVVEKNINSYGQKINLWSDFLEEYFSTSAGELYPDPCFPGYVSALTDLWNQGVYEWNIVLQMKPESDINLNIVDCVMEHDKLDIWNGADQTGRYRASWGELFFVPTGNPHVTVEAIPGPHATPGFEERFNLDARTHPGLFTVPLVNAHYTSKAFWEEGIIMALPETGTSNGQGQSVYNLKDGDNIHVTIEIPMWNTVDIHYGVDSVILKYVGIIGTEYVTADRCSE